MKTIVRIYFTVLSRIAPRIAAKMAFNLFQRPLNKKLRPKEEAFFKKTSNFKIKFSLEDITYYETGSNTGKLIILVHGWESNAASMSAIATKLANTGHRVISFNLPAHGFSLLKKTNLKACKEALTTVINHINPKEKFSIVAHSFGSAVTAYALSKTSYPIDKLVFLTTPNKIIDVFTEFGSLIGLTLKAQTAMNNMASKLLNEPLETMTVERLASMIHYTNITIIHDKYDKVIHINKSRRVQSQLANCDLIELERKGHYRMLWDEEVIDLVSKTLMTKQIERVSDKTILI